MTRTVMAGMMIVLALAIPLLAQSIDSSDDGNRNIAQMNVPVNGAKLSGNSQAFTWNEIPGVKEYWLRIGTEGTDSKDVYDVNVGNVRFHTVYNLPENGSRLYVRLYTSVGKDKWKYNDYEYLASGVAQPETLLEKMGKRVKETSDKLKVETEQIKQAVSKVLGKDVDKELEEITAKLETDALNFDLTVTFCLALEKKIDNILEAIKTVLEKDLTKDQKSIVTGLEQLSVILDDLARKVESKANHAEFSVSRDRWQTLSGTHRKLSFAYGKVGEYYSSIDIAKNIRLLTESQEYLHDAKDLVVQVREVLLPIVGSQSAILSLKEYQTQIEQVKAALDAFSNSVANLSVDPEKHLAKFMEDADKQESEKTSTPENVKPLASPDSPDAGKTEPSKK